MAKGSLSGVLRAAFALACAAGSACSVPDYTYPPGPPVIERFEATPFEIPRGGEALVAWRVSGADVVRLEGLGERAEPVALDDARVVTTTVARWLGLVAESAAGVARATLELRLREREPARIVRFDVSPALARPDELVRIRWAVEHASRVMIRRADGLVLIDGAPEVGSTSLRVTEDVSLELRVDGASGPLVETRTVRVSNAGPLIEDFGVDPPAATPSERATVHFRVRRADSVRVESLRDDGSLGVLLAMAGTNELVELPLDPALGSQTITLTARNEVGAVSESARFIALPSRAPEILDLSLSPTVNGPGGDTILRFATRFADEVVLDVPGEEPRSLPTRGTLVLPVRASIDLELIARDRRSSQEVRRGARVTIDPARPSLDLLVSPTVVTRGDTVEIVFSTERATQVHFDTDSGARVATFTDAMGRFGLRIDDTLFLFGRAENARGETFRVVPFEVAR